MSLFDGVEKEIAQQRYESIKEKAPNVKQGEINRCKAMFDELWAGLTMAEAQAVLDLFGAEAFSLFQYHSAWQTFLQTVDRNYQWLTPPFKVDVVDGLVVLSDLTLSEPEPSVVI